MTKASPPEIEISGSRDWVTIKPGGGIVIENKVIADIVKSGIASAAGLDAEGDVQPMISITIK